MTDKPTFKRPRSGRADRDAMIEWELGDDEVDREEDDDGSEERERCGEPRSAALDAGLVAVAPSFELVGEVLVDAPWCAGGGRRGVVPGVRALKRPLVRRPRSHWRGDVPHTISPVSR